MIEATTTDELNIRIRNRLWDYIINIETYKFLCDVEIRFNRQGGDVIVIPLSLEQMRGLIYSISFCLSTRGSGVIFEKSIFYAYRDSWTEDFPNRFSMDFQFTFNMDQDPPRNVWLPYEQCVEFHKALESVHERIILNDVMKT